MTTTNRNALLTIIFLSLVMLIASVPTLAAIPGVYDQGFHDGLDCVSVACQQTHNATYHNGQHTLDILAIAYEQGFHDGFDCTYVLCQQNHNDTFHNQ